MNNWKFDLAVDEIDESQVSIGNRGQLVLPAPVEVKFTEGTSAAPRCP